MITTHGAVPPVRMTLAEPSRRTVTILGPDGRPVPGVRVAPVLCAFDRRGLFQTPDDRLERLTISSAGDGVANASLFPVGDRSAHAAGEQHLASSPTIFLSSIVLPAIGSP